MGLSPDFGGLFKKGVSLLWSAGAGLRVLRRRINAWRRIRFTLGGLVFTVGSFAVGFAAFNTGNNLLYLLFGAMLGLIVVSGWLSEQVIRDLTVLRRPPRGVTVGNPLRIQYEVENHKKWIPSFTLEIGEEGLPGLGSFPLIRPGDRVSARSENRFVHRGVLQLEAVTISTSFPFGLFLKSRDIRLKGELVVWPRSDRTLRPPVARGDRNPLSGSLTAGSAGPRGEYRGLRSYRPGDDPRDIHWRTTARLGRPVVREYEQNETEALWLCLDTRGTPGDRVEVAIEMVASLAAGAFREGRRFGLVTPDQTVEPGLGPGQMERILTALAKVDFKPDAPRPLPPVAPRQCILVTTKPGASHAFGDMYSPPEEPRR
ncbi:MAG: DUF58 domain-containing protein [Gemmatimonadota bacterium]